MSRFKVGDRVRVRDIKVGSTVGVTEFVEDMRCLCGLEGTVTGLRASDGKVNCIDFDVPHTDGEWIFVDEWLEAVDYKVNLAALLSRCVGVHLWCPIYGYGEVVNVDVGTSDSDSMITVVFPCLSNGGERHFTATGQFVGSLSSSECMLYPSAQQLTWGSCCGRVRVPRGESYFYIGSDLRVGSIKDLNTVVDSTRFVMGNYFSTESDVEVALGKILPCLTEG